MRVRCFWEHNGEDSLLYAIDLVGAYTRGPSKEIALAKMPQEAVSYWKWSGSPIPEEISVEIVQSKSSDLAVADADSDAIFQEETLPLTMDAYCALKQLVLKSAEDFLTLYQSVPNADVSSNAVRETFYGNIPRTAREMYAHTKNVNAYYFKEIGIDADNGGTIYECRKRGFDLLEQSSDFLSNPVMEGSYGESWSLRKLMRRFLWHDRIHAKAMYRMAQRTFGATDCNPFVFEL